MEFLAASLLELITQTSTNLPPDVRRAMSSVLATETPATQSLQALNIIATNIDMANDEESKVFEAIKAGMIAFAKGFNPIVSVEFARRAIPGEYRPTFQAMEDYVKGRK